MSRVSILSGLAICTAVVVVVPGQASLYEPDRPRAALPVSPDGVARALPFDEFQRRFADLTKLLNPTLQENPERDLLLKQIADRQKVRNRGPLDTAALAADLLRAGELDKAEAVLAGDRRGFLPNMTLAHIYAGRHDWGQAAEYLTIANEEPPPEQLPGLTKPQLAWQLQLNREYLPRLFESRWQASRARPRPPPEDETYDPLFPPPVRFVNDAGAYEPGILSAAERAKLPPDALAVVQQLLLWFPSDTKLYWLLAELYAAEGQLAAAQRIMDVCVSEARQYGNRKLLAEHRTAVRAAIAARPEVAPADVPLGVQPTPEPPPPQQPVSMTTVWVYFGLVAAVAALAMIRVLGKRGQGHGGPSG